MTSTGHDAARASTTSPIIARRTLLSAAAALPVVAMPAPAAPHPDAALLDAWAGYVQANRTFDHACDALPDGGTDADHEPHYRAIDVYRHRIEQHQASTVEGFAVQLRYLFAEYMETRAATVAAVYGEPVNEELAAALVGDYRDRMLWAMAQSATRAFGGEVRS